MPIDANRGKGECPRIIFTLDFHVLVYGDLMGGDCVVLYDPNRMIASESEIAGLPETQRPIVMHVRFHPSGRAWEGEMRFKKADRLMVDKDASGEGTMLRLEYPIPAGDDMGANFWLRFPNHDLMIARADIMARENEAMDLFQLEVNSVAAVESMMERRRYTNAINDARYQLPLEPVMLGDRKQWMLGENGARSRGTLRWRSTWFTRQADTRSPMTTRARGTWSAGPSARRYGYYARRPIVSGQIQRDLHGVVAGSDARRSVDPPNAGGRRARPPGSSGTSIQPATCCRRNPTTIAIAGMLGLGIFDDDKIDLKRFSLR